LKTCNLKKKSLTIFCTHPMPFIEDKCLNAKNVKI
jgi:hypothetical protein